MKNKEISPFLKWPGGKQWFVKQYVNILPSNFKNYYEPFLGGGAVFFSLQPKRAVLSDTNKDLINLYIFMRNNPEDLKELMKYHQEQHCKQYYYDIREHESLMDLESAGRFLYLNRTCFNGMYRVNRQGKFNVPIGSKNNCIYDIDHFNEYSSLLKRAKIVEGDFMNIITRSGKEDLIFADPPYTVQKKQRGFIKYNDQLFTWNDQLRLYEGLSEAKKRGVKVVLTNVDCIEIYDMYKSSGFFIKTLERNSSMASKVSKRGTVKELLITSYDINENK